MTKIGLKYKKFLKFLLFDICSRNYLFINNFFW